MKVAQLMLDAIAGIESDLGGLPLHFLERESVRRIGAGTEAPVEKRDVCTALI